MKLAKLLGFASQTVCYFKTFFQKNSQDKDASQGFILKKMFSKYFLIQVVRKTTKYYQMVQFQFCLFSRRQKFPLVQLKEMADDNLNVAKMDDFFLR